MYDRGYSGVTLGLADTVEQPMARAPACFHLQPQAVKRLRRSNWRRGKPQQGFLIRYSLRHSRDQLAFRHRATG